MASRREIYALIGAACVLFATVTNRLLSYETMGMGMNAGFRGIGLCTRGRCVSTDDHTGFGTFAFVLGLVCVAALVGAVVMDRTQEDDRLWRPAGLLTAAWCVFVIIWYLDIGMTGTSFGIGFWAGLAGAGAAIFVSLWQGDQEITGNERLTERAEDIEAGLAKYYKNKPPEDAEAAAPESEPASESRASANQESRPPATKLRFVAKTLTISDQGVVASFEAGAAQELPFGQLKQLVARRLPRELGHGQALLLDLVSTETPDSPIRILPTTAVNYQYLPEGESSDPSINARRLASLMLALQPDLAMDEGSKLFVAGSGTGLPFKSVDHFWEYDSRYPA